MKEDYLKIKNLLERFFEGQTTNDEEQLLYDFFERDDLPDEWLQYKPVMKYFESGLADEIVDSEQTDMPPLQIEKKNVISLAKMRKYWITWSGIAASILLILFTTLYLFTDNDPVDPFAGSYIIRNGVRITDLDLIRPELEAAVQKGLKMEQETDRLFEQLSQFDDNQEVQMIKQMREHNNRILDNIRDEDVRKEVEEIINTQF